MIFKIVTFFGLLGGTIVAAAAVNVFMDRYYRWFDLLDFFYQLTYK